MKVNDRYNDYCAICRHYFHLAPECLPCQQWTHCTQRGEHERCLFDHTLPGGMFYRDPMSGRTPLAEYVEKVTPRLCTVEAK